MFLELFQELGLPINEGKIYESLLSERGSTAGEISSATRIHRRNVYDSLRNLQHRGLVFEVRGERENRYEPVEPRKLLELVDEKRSRLLQTLPELESLYDKQPREHSVLVYRGIEGWKNYMRDVLRLGEDYYCIAGKGGWMDERLQDFFPWFSRELSKRNIACHVLFDAEVDKNNHPVVEHVGPNYRFLPKEFSSQASVEVFGNRVNLVTNIKLGQLDRDFDFTVIVNEELANGFRNWFKFMYDACPKR